MIWRLETGERISILDTLASSTSLISTITSLFRLRIISGLGVILVAVWALSPVGGQASFRQFSVGTRTDSEPALYKYTTSSGYNLYYEIPNRMSPGVIDNSLFAASIVASSHTKASPVDLWSNVKIPRIEHFESKNNIVSDQDGWYNTGINQNQDSDPMLFTSLTGIPMAGFENSDFINNRWNIQASYFNISNCVPSNASFGRLPPNTSYVSHNDSGLIWWNSSTDNTTEGYHSPRSNISYINGSMPAFRFGYASQIGPIAPGECSIQTIYVEVEVFCADASSCLVSRMRRSKLDHPHANITKLDFQTVTYWNWYLFASGFVTSVGGQTDEANLLDNYILGSDDLVAINSVPGDQPNYLSVIRLGQLINTCWSTTSGPDIISRELARSNETFDSTFSYSIVREIGFGDSGFFNGSYWQTQGIRSRRIEVFQAHTAWVITLCIASTILIIASLIPLIVRQFLTKGPDIMMNISSLATRDNPYVQIPSSGTFLEASDRARLLRDCRVRFGDIDAGGGVGKLVIGEMREEGGEGIGRVREGRVYA
ncbi:hypothetical protein EJ04DRAFT_594034 [Polyplosphaeria fusca]|uniref:Uncharacterized protein n=1 Tax=Polyplosphaeria fusca TaxID=682080 RepID=A0A9P4QI56_9PLEO|nr:hypothetical protein EJ04DRAFT_594034 [Polyplosphaeria fusca]